MKLLKRRKVNVFDPSLNLTQCNIDYPDTWGGPSEVVSITVCFFYKELNSFIYGKYVIDLSAINRFIPCK